MLLTVMGNMQQQVRNRLEPAAVIHANPIASAARPVTSCVLPASSPHDCAGAASPSSVMKTIITALLLIVITACSPGCKSTGTSSTTDFFNPDGKKVASHKEKTRTTGLFVNSQTANPSGTISYTNSVTLTNGFSFHVSETKDFKAGAANYRTDAEGLKAGGQAGGQVIGTALGTKIPGQ